MTICRPASFLLSALVLGAMASPATADDTLLINSATATVSIQPQPPGRNFLRLPSIEFSFDIELVCHDDRTAGSLSLTVADTREFLGADEIASSELEGIVVLVPEKQLAPLAVDNFCVQDTTVAATRRREERIVVPDVLSAHASLLCAAEDSQTMTYVSRPLDIVLTCERPAEQEATGSIEL
jgi:hypothetical protein